MASIVVISGMSRGNYLALAPRVMSIGRDERCDMQVLDERVSRRHLEVGPGAGPEQYVVADVSAHGAKVNGRPLKQPSVLHDGDVIGIGGSELVFTIRPIKDREGALSFAAHGERYRPTVDPR
jgi:pSer/pThr/pTyr-binding forkhead associated (FHA) protein